MALDVGFRMNWHELESEDVMCKFPTLCHATTIIDAEAVIARQSYTWNMHGFCLPFSRHPEASALPPHISFLTKSSQNVIFQ